MITTGNFPKALVGGKTKVNGPKMPKKGTQAPKLGMIFARKGKRGS